MGYGVWGMGYGRRPAPPGVRVWPSCGGAGSPGGMGYGQMLAGRTARGMGYTTSLYPLHGANRVSVVRACWCRGTTNKLKLRTPALALAPKSTKSCPSFSTSSRDFDRLQPGFYFQCHARSSLPKFRANARPTSGLSVTRRRLLLRGLISFTRSKSPPKVYQWRMSESRACSGVRAVAWQSLGVEQERAGDGIGILGVPGRVGR